MRRRVHWVPNEEWSAMERARYAEYVARGEEDGTLLILVPQGLRMLLFRARAARRDWWHRTPLNVRMWRASKRARRTWEQAGIDPRHPDALAQMLGRIHLQRRPGSDEQAAA